MLGGAFLLPPVCGYRTGVGHAQHFLYQLALAVETYEKHYGEYPPGDGRGSRDLVRILGRPGPHRLRFCEFQPEQLIDGDLANPIQPGAPPGGVVRYVRYPAGSRPPYRLTLSDGLGGELSAP